jgi:hypothetical protein
MLKGSVTKSINTHGRLSFYYPRKCDGAIISGFALFLGVFLEFSGSKSKVAKYGRPKSIGIVETLVF